MQFCVTIDTEEEWDWQSGFPVQTHGVENISRLKRFNDLCNQWNVKSTYFVNHAVLCDKTAAEVIVELGSNPFVEIGMHLHPWTTPPYIDVDNCDQTSFLENLPPDVALAKLQSTYEIHRQYGFRPTSFRGGRYSTGSTTRKFLNDNGFVVDASICPFTYWDDEGAPDYRFTAEIPEKLEESSSGNCQLWSLPLTRVFSRRPFAFWNRIISTLETTSLARLRLIGLLEKTGIVRRIWLNFETETEEAMVWLVKNAHRLDLPYLCFTVHSSSLSVGPGPYSKTQAQVEKIYSGIEAVFQALADDARFEPATISEIGKRLQQRSSE